MRLLGSITKVPLDVSLRASNDLELLCLETEALTLEQKVTQFFEQFRDSVYRYLTTVLGNSSEAEDVTQEAFFQLHRCLQEGQNIREVRSWIFRVAHNLAIKHKLKGKFLVPMDSDSWEAVCNRRQDSRPSPEQSMINQEFRKRFETGLEKLSPLQRQCLLLRAEGFKYEQIARILNTSLSHVAQSLRRGLHTMRKNHYE